MSGAPPAGTVRAPGRVNLIGDHTDYNDGFVLPAALDLACVVDWRRASDQVVSVRSRNVAADAALVTIDLEALPRPGDVTPEWGRLVAAVIAELRRSQVELVGIDATLSSSVPSGAGLSSSAAVEVAIARALLDAAGSGLDPLELARLTQRAEQLASGVPCGIMDQLTSVAGVEGHALLIDCRSLDVQPVPVPPSMEFVVAHTGQSRTLVGSEYAARRAQCEATCERLGITHLRDATPEQVADVPVARHVVSENARVLEAAAALRAFELDRLGALFTASHASLRDDFEVSTAALDALVEELVRAGAAGARLTGAGFGGCVVAVTAAGEANAVAARALERYRDRTGLEPASWPVRASAGASSV